MRRKHLLSLFMLSMGVALLVTALAAGGASARSQAGPGGTFSIGSIGRVSAVDPAAAYDTRSWTAINLTADNLIQYPDQNDAASHLHLLGAQSWPVFSNQGKTMTWTINPGMQFSDGTYVTAASYVRSFERVLSSCEFAGGFGAVDFFDKDIVGASAFHKASCDGTGQATYIDSNHNGTKDPGEPNGPAHISGLSGNAKPGGGGTLVINLVKPVASFQPAMAMMWFDPVPADTPYETNRQAFYPGAGPYHVTSYAHSPATGDVMLTLGRNPNYNGGADSSMPRPALPDVIRYIKYASGNNEGCYNDVTANVAPPIDWDACGLTGTEASSAEGYGASTTTGVPGAAPGGGTRFHVESTGCSGWFAMNSTVAGTNSLAARKALGYIVNKDGILSVLGDFAGQYDSSIMTPAIPGYKPDNVFGHLPNWTKANNVGGKTALKNKTLHIWYVGDSDPAVQQEAVIESNINAYSSHFGVGINVVQEPHSNTQYYTDLGTWDWITHGGNTLSGPSGPMNLASVGWCADYNDPFDYINVMFSGSTIVKGHPDVVGDPCFDESCIGANTNYSNANISKLNTQMNNAAALQGTAYRNAYGALDKAIVGTYALAIPFEQIGARILVSNRVDNSTWAFNNYQTTPAVNLISVN